MEVETDESDLMVRVSVAVDTEGPEHGHFSWLSGSLLDFEGVSLSLNSPQTPKSFRELLFGSGA